MRILSLPEGKSEGSLFGVRELAPAFETETICIEQSGGKPPHSKKSGPPLRTARRIPCSILGRARLLPSRLRDRTPAPPERRPTLHFVRRLRRVCNIRVRAQLTLWQPQRGDTRKPRAKRVCERRPGKAFPPVGKPCKGGPKFASFGPPFQGLVFLSIFPRAWPWAALLRPFRPFGTKLEMCQKVRCAPVFAGQGR